MSMSEEKEMKKKEKEVSPVPEFNMFAVKSSRFKNDA
jgi:hypothetical protein